MGVLEALYLSDTMRFFPDYWEKLQPCLDSLACVPTQAVFSQTVVMGLYRIHPVFLSQNVGSTTEEEFLC